MAEQSISDRAKQQLLDLINSDNSTDVKLHEIDISIPEEVNFSGRNTKVIVNAKTDSPYAGDQEIYYNRLAVSRLGYIGILTAEPITVAKIFEIISSRKQINLLQEEFEDLVVPVLEQGDIRTITLKSKAQAIKWYGETAIEIAFGLPSNLDAFHMFLHVTLPSDGYLI